MTYLKPSIKDKQYDDSLQVWGGFDSYYVEHKEARLSAKLDTDKLPTSRRVLSYPVVLTSEREWWR